MSATSTNFRVNPYRFSADPTAMVDFLEALGMERVEAVAGNHFVLLAAGAGYVAVHDAAESETQAEPGETQFAFLAADVDESGYQEGVAAPRGGGIWITESSPEITGWKAANTAGFAELVVTPVWYTNDMAEDAAFFSRFGFAAQPGGSEWWTALNAGTSSGVIGLHKQGDEIVTRDTPGSPLEAVSLISLGFETSEDLGTMVDRLKAAGYDAEVVTTEGLGDAVHVTDPDGQKLQIHPHQTADAV